jgi:hypothetical protein
MKHGKLALSLLLLLLLGTVGVASADPIVTNGNFSTPSVPGSYIYNPSSASWSFQPLTWTNLSPQSDPNGSGIQGNGSAWGFSNVPVAVGTQSAFLQGVSTISQDITLVPGQEYKLSFYLEQRPNYGVDPVTVSIGGTTFSGVDPLSTSAWTLYTDTFTANSSTELLSFSTSNNLGDNDAGLAGVSVTATPEPSTVILFGSSLLGLFGAVRRKFGKNV